MKVSLRNLLRKVLQSCLGLVYTRFDLRSYCRKEMGEIGWMSAGLYAVAFA